MDTIIAEKTVTVTVVGGSGYTGRELLRRLARHPGVEVLGAASRSEAGGATPIPGLAYAALTPAEAARAEVVFLCLPHGETAPWIDAALASGARIVDLTSDHRPGAEGAHPDAVYGLTEWFGPEIEDATLVANPGCYPTAALTALLPLDRAGLLGEGPISIHAASGVTGAGRSPRKALQFGELTGDFRAYGLGNEHRHLREMRALLSARELLFLPHLLPVERGILETIVLPVRPGTTATHLRESWSARYADSPVVHVVDAAPTLRDVTRSDLLLLSAFDNADLPGWVTVVAALDNLGKGAAGQAVQNFNRMVGHPTTWGLECAPS